MSRSYLFSILAGLAGCSSPEDTGSDLSAVAGGCDYSRTAYPVGCEADTCLIPLTESVPSESYTTATELSIGLGIYGDMATSEIAAHRSAGRALAGGITPRDAGGDPDPAGKIGFIALGLSNTTQTFSTVVTKHEQAIENTFVYKATNDPSVRNDRIVFVDGAIGGCQLQCAVGWSSCSSCGLGNAVNPTLMAHAARQVAGAGLTPEQVQVAWVKSANHYTDDDRMEYMVDGFVQLLIDARKTFPNLRIAFVSSRIYGGYAV